jgi:hypothetical protein
MREKNVGIMVLSTRSKRRKNGELKVTFTVNESGFLFMM